MRCPSSESNSSGGSRNSSPGSKRRSTGREWVTRRYPKKLRDEARQVYEVPALHLQKGPTNLLLDPIGYDVPGAEGAADLYLMPAIRPHGEHLLRGRAVGDPLRLPTRPDRDALRDRDPDPAPLRRDDQPGPQLDRRTCRTVGLTGTNTSSEVWGEYRSARAAVDRLRAAVVATPDLLKNDRVAPEYLSQADKNLEGTYIVRLFAAFEAALRSYDRAKHNDPARETKAAVMIDKIGGKRGRGIQQSIRERAHDVAGSVTTGARIGRGLPGADDRRRGPSPAPDLPSRTARRMGLIARPSPPRASGPPPKVSPPGELHPSPRGTVAA